MRYSSFVFFVLYGFAAMIWHPLQSGLRFDFSYTSNDFIAFFLSLLSDPVDLYANRLLPSVLPQYVLILHVYIRFCNVSF
jgi:hypothetical protein